MTKKLFTSVALLLLFNFNVKSQNAIHSYTAFTIDSNVFHFSSLIGKKVLIVNTASFCGFTNQYSSLQQLYQTYNSNNFEILGFPCNDFGGQEPDKDSTINSFCTTNFGVTFQMMKKIAITSADTAPVYKWLQRMNLNNVSNASVSWNFNKFLIDECGNWVAHYSENTNPLDTAITNWINSPSCILPTGISNKNLLNGIKITSSNPAFNNIKFVISKTIEKPIEVNLFTIDGKLIKHLSYNQIKPDLENGINITDVKAGMYLLVFKTEGFQKNTKILIEN